jgi:hypothetical protein
MTDEWNEQQMTALDTNMGGATIGGTLAATLGTLTAGGNLQGNTKKIAKSFQNAWRGAAAYHFYMLALRQLYNGEDDDEDDDDRDDEDDDDDDDRDDDDDDRDDEDDRDDRDDDDDDDG